MRFEWNDKKNESNIKKHGVSFDHAMRIFADRNRKEFYDEQHSFLEERFTALGFAANAVLFVVFTEPEPGRKRIISARKATKREEVFYYGNG